MTEENRPQGEETPEPRGGAPASEPAPRSEEGASTEEPLARLEAERDELRQKLLRVAADFDNFRKRTRKELEEAERRGREAVLRELLPIVDNLERAVQSASGAQSVDAVVKGVQMVLRLFEETASRIGLHRIGTVGERFDPNVHDAVQQQETDEHPPGTVVGELIPGYKLGEKLLRAAMVVVAKPKPSEPEEPEPKEEGEEGGRAGDSESEAPAQGHGASSEGSEPAS